MVLLLLLAAVAGTSLWWMLYAWRTPDGLGDTSFPASRTPRHSFSLIVPARHEQEVLERTLTSLARLDHPAFEVLAVVGDDDPETAAAAERAASVGDGRVRVIRDGSWPKNKPRALNHALPACRGDVVGVFDAEDDVPAGLLRRVDALLQTSDATVVQGGVQLENFWSNWFSVRNCLEYYFWFRSRLHYHAARRFIPLGGNTVFVRRRELIEAGGWDPDCLAEDCELGVRLSADGALVEVAYEPTLVTREETPSDVGALFRQRTRWNQGFLQVLRKGEWRRLDGRGRRFLAWYTLAMPFLQAATGVLVPFAIATIFVLEVPLGLALLSFVPLALTLITLAVELVGLHDLQHVLGVRARARDYVRLIVGTPVYQVVLAGAAIRAVWRELRGRRDWEKTAHAGLHRSSSSGPALP